MEGELEPYKANALRSHLLRISVKFEEFLPRDNDYTWDASPTKMN
jgi:hypothetical protein